MAGIQHGATVSTTNPNLGTRRIRISLLFTSRSVKATVDRGFLADQAMFPYYNSNDLFEKITATILSNSDETKISLKSIIPLNEVKRVSLIYRSSEAIEYAYYYRLSVRAYAKAIN